jgi:DNA ligase D-like protein (predicted ligase)
LLFKSGRKVILKSRNNNILNESYPEIVAAFEPIDIEPAIIDGELVAFEGRQTSFAKLQSRFGIDNSIKARATKISVYYYIFDILYFAGYDLTQLPLITRKKILKHCMPYKTPIHYTVHHMNHGLKYFNQACTKGWEGIIAKKADSIYVTKRSDLWLKFKCVNEQEFVIGGFTQPRYSRVGFGALLLGFYKNNKLMYAGKVGTGFNEEMLIRLKKKLETVHTVKSPFSDYDDTSADITWVRPVLVCQVGFTEWTRDNKLRHPTFLGLRYDKSAHEVVQEI